MDIPDRRVHPRGVCRLFRRLWPSEELRDLNRRKEDAAVLDYFTLVIYEISTALLRGMPEPNICMSSIQTHTMSKTNSRNTVSTVTSRVHAEPAPTQPWHNLVFNFVVTGTDEENGAVAWHFEQYFRLPDQYLIPPDKRTRVQQRNIARFCERFAGAAVSWFDRFDNLHGKLATEDGCIMFPGRVYDADVDSSDEDMAEAEAAGAEAAEDM
jgi:hypothetical protein